MKLLIQKIPGSDPLPCGTVLGRDTAWFGYRVRGGCTGALGLVGNRYQDVFEVFSPSAF